MPEMKRKDNPNKVFTARYDPITGEIQGLIPGTYNADYSVVATPEIVSDPRQWKYDFSAGQMVKKPEKEIAEILRIRAEGKARAARMETLIDEFDALKAEMLDLKSKLVRAKLIAL